MHYLHGLLGLLVVVVSVGVLLLLGAELLAALRQQVLVRQVAALLVTLERTHELRGDLKSNVSIYMYID